MLVASETRLDVPAPSQQVAPTSLSAVHPAQVAAEEALSVRWTFDERIDDGFSSARSLALVQKILEDPDRWLGPPEGTPRWLGTEADARVP